MSMRRWCGWLLATIACLGLTAVRAAEPLCENSDQFICGPVNPEDLLQLPGTDLIVASAVSRGAGLSLIDSRSRVWRRVYGATLGPASTLYKECSSGPDWAEIAFHGLSLRTRDDGTLVLYAVAHGSRESIEVFEVGIEGDLVSLVWTGCALMPDGLAANSVVSLADGSLLATVLVQPGKTYGQAAKGKPTGAVYYWSPGNSGFRLLEGTELPANNGIEVSADGSEFYVVATEAKQVVAFDLADTSKPKWVAQLSGFRPDNLHLTVDGKLLTAGTADKKSRFYRVAVLDPKTKQWRFTDAGKHVPYRNVSSALLLRGELWLGSYSDDRIATQSIGAN